MALNIIREGSAYTTTTLLNGQTVTDAALNGFRDASNSFTRRGVQVVSVQGERVNTFVMPFHGIGETNFTVAGSSTTQHGGFLPAGADSFSLTFQYGLFRYLANPTSGAPVTVRPIISAAIVRGGANQTIFTHQAPATGTTQTWLRTVTGQLLPFMTANFHAVERIYLVITLDLSGGNADAVGYSVSGHARQFLYRRNVREFRSI